MMTLSDGVRRRVTIGSAPPTRLRVTVPVIPTNLEAGLESIQELIAMHALATIGRQRATMAQAREAHHVGLVRSEHSTVVRVAAA